MLILIVTAAFAAVILFLRNGLYKLPQNGSANDTADGGGLGRTFSIIVAARNEAENLPACLDSIFSQDMPADRYEVVIADDRSTDATPQILCGAAAERPNLRVVTITQTPPGISPKKHAVTTAVAASKNEIIAFTDADCVVPPTWLSSLNKHFADDGVAMVQGITTYSRPPDMDSRFWGLQSVDFLSHGIIAAAAIAADLPINSNANNMAFRRKVFDAIGGYEANAKVVPGDDDQLLQRVWAYGRNLRKSSAAGKDNACPNRVVFMTDPAGAVETAPTPTLAMLFEQRRRWGAVTVHYGARQIVLLSAVFAFYLTIAATAVISIFSPARYLPIFLSLMLVKLTGELALMIPGSRIFQKKHLRKYIFPASIIQLPVTLASVIFGVFGGFKWKGRKSGRTVEKRKRTS